MVLITAGGLVLRNAVSCDVPWRGEAACEVPRNCRTMSVVKTSVASLAFIAVVVGSYVWIQDLNAVSGVTKEAVLQEASQEPRSSGQRRPASACFAHAGHGPNTTSVLAEGQWYFSSKNVCEDGTVREYQLNNAKCRLKRYTAEEVLKCLANKTVALVGDSIVRHQAVNIMEFLESGEYSFPCGVTSSPQKCNSDPHQTNAWMMSHNLNYICGGQIRCDNIRKQLRDNLYFYNPEYNVNISYFGYFQAAFGNGPVGWYPNNAPFNEEAPLWWDVQLPELVDVLSKLFTPFDEIVVNSGVWFNKEFEDSVDRAREQLEKFSTIMKDPRNPPTWETTTLKKSKLEDKEHGTQAAQALGWKIFDRRGITLNLASTLEGMGVPLEAAWPDDAHFTGYPNNEMNNALYNLWCGSQ